MTVEEMLMGRGTQEVTVEEGLEVMGEGLDEVSGRGLVWAGHGVGGTWCGCGLVWAGHGVGVACVGGTWCGCGLVMVGDYWYIKTFYNNKQ